MRKLHAALLAAGGLALAAGTAYAAAKYNTMNVALPDGSVAQITYQGDVPPRVAVVPAQAAAAQDPFAEIERMSAMMQARHEAMMRQSAEMQQRMQQQVERQVAAAQQGGAGQYSQSPGQIVVTSNAPAGSSYSYSVVSSSSGANGCTQVVEMRSNGSGKEPQVTRTSSGDCGKAEKKAPAAPAAAKPAQDQARIPAGTI